MKTKILLHYKYILPQTLKPSCVLASLTYFQSSRSGQNNIITSEVAKIQYYVRIANKFSKACQCVYRSL